MAPTLINIDHIHLYVTNRIAAQAWYAEVLGLSPVPELLSWADDGGPLTIANADASIHLALFERAPQPNRATIAFAVTAAGLLTWQQHLGQVLSSVPALVDHQLSWSLYFTDPDGNPFEITTYEYKEVIALQVPSLG
ncbi:MAG: VOC family protein [Burkholderiales bacterium]|nr:VOC family protein [Burkholderiales bacterium]